MHQDKEYADNAQLDILVLPQLLLSLQTHVQQEAIAQPAHRLLLIAQLDITIRCKRNLPSVTVLNVIQEAIVQQLD